MGSNTEQYCLRWNDFQSNITGAFSDIRDDEDFLDVTLVCDGQTVKAHKLVLSACSPLFRTMLKKNTHPQPMIFLHGVRYSDISAILNFMYHGEVNVNQEDLQTFLAAAEELRIRGLSDKSAMDNSSENRTSPPSTKRFKSDKTTPSSATTPNNSNVSKQTESNKKKGVVITPDMPPGGEYNDNSSSQSETYGGYGYDGGSSNNLNLYGQSGRSRGVKDEENGLGQNDSWYAPQQQRHQQQAAFFNQQLQSRPVCPYCNKELKNNHSLNVHISRYHTEGSQSDQEVICPVCERKYGNKYSLRTHMHLNHKDQLHLLGTSGRRGRRQVPSQGGENQTSKPGSVGKAKDEAEDDQEEDEEGFGYFQ